MSPRLIIFLITPHSLSCLKRHTHDACRLIQRMPDNIAKAECFTAIECTREAAEVAAKLKDQDLFARIQGLSNTRGLAIAQERFRTGFR